MKILKIIAGASVLIWADWVKDSKDPAYPSELYFVGYGISDVSLDKAKSQAQNDIQKQIRVSLRTKLIDNMESETFRGKEFNSESTNMTSFSVGLGELEGVQIVKSEQRDNLFYALAALDKSLFANNLKTEISRLNDEIFTLVNSAKENLSAKEIAKAINGIYAARKKLNQVDDFKKSLRAVETPGANLNSPYSDVELMQLISDAVKSISVKKIMGDEQKFTLGTLPKEPFVFKITSNDGQPIIGFEYKVLHKNREIGTVLSDENGEFVYYASELARFKKGKSELVFEPMLRLASKYQKEIRRLTLDFSVETMKSTNAYNFKIKGLESKEEVLSLLQTLENRGFSDDKQASDEVEILVKKEVLMESQGLAKKIQKINLELVVKGPGIDEVFKEKGLGSSPKRAFENALSKIDFNLESLKQEPVANLKEISIAVLPFNVVGDQNVQSMALMIRNQLVVKLSNLRGITLSERENISQVLSEKTMVLTGLSEGDDFEELQITGADYIVAGSLSKSKNEFQISLRLIDSKRGKVLKSIQEFESDTNKLKSIATKLISGLGIKKLQN